MQLSVQDAFALAARHEAEGRSADARTIYEEILASLPEHPGALLRIAEQEMAAGNHDAALARLQRALSAARRTALPAQEIWLALVRLRLARGERSEVDAAIDELHAIAIRLKAAGAAGAARELLEQCVAFAPDHAGLRVTLGGVCLDDHRPAAARQHLERAVALGAPSAEAWDNLGLALRQLGEESEALASFERAAAAAPSLTPALANVVYTSYALCEWGGLEERERRLIATLDDPSSDPRWSPWIALSMPITPAQQLAVARRWAGAMLPAVAPRQRPPAARGQRLRIGYLSGNFHDHPTGRLMAGLFEQHDRKRFELFGYAYGSGSDSPVRERVRAALDRWRDLDAVSDSEASRLIREDGIDVLIERHGYTLGGRLGILASRPAPVQLHYMSFPGSLGYDAVDGVIADAEVIPPEDEVFFHERVWRLPRCYYVNDSRRGMPAATSRSANALPENAVVLACFNQSERLRRALFATWLAALEARKDAVLWLLAGHPRTQENLRAEAERAEVDPRRLIFAPRRAQETHIARIACADLALDTLPYGAHTTGCDALWCGVPMLTCRGATFAGRVGASLLKASALPELVTATPEEYGQRLLELVSNPARLRDYRAQLERTRETNPLFDTAGFTRDWETLLLQIYEQAAR
ncbi:MAG TPA: tetratricopeptide repeat protein [Casimicrobiaceae bacterium]|jgi:predicted O-linked N-acetylglucosamine transferase (SPINDLY family)|nr:tetratricopeptide repeat protein [Casimicrobiaceae bacterium]